MSPETGRVLMTHAAGAGRPSAARTSPRLCDAQRVINHPSAPPGKATKYARFEYERRFLLAEQPAATRTQIVDILDRYIVGTRLRLRRVQPVPPAGQPPTFKLTQKVPADDGGPGLITNTYLSASEYDLLATLPAAVLAKRRHSIPPLGVDVFGGPLTGLVLAEAEFDTDGECRTFEPPHFVIAEVTIDPRFTGGRLAVTSTEELGELLASFGL